MNPQDLPPKSNLAKYMNPKRMITWDENGIPRSFTDWLLPKNKIDDIVLASFALPYEGTFDTRLEQLILEPEYEGLTNIEVACIKQAKKAASGDLEALRFTIERILGKPKQAVEQTTVTMSLKEYLQSIDISDIVDTVANEVKMDPTTESNSMEEYDV
jgi:hypothetical protein